MFYDDHGFPDKTNDCSNCNNCLHNIDGGVILRQRKSPVPQLDVVGLDFCYDFKEALHGAQLAKDLDISHLDPSHANQLIALIKGYWTVLDENGTFTPVCGVGPQGNGNYVQEHCRLSKIWSYPSDT
jgi:hypothetical protein